MDRAQLDDWLEKGILGLVLGALLYAPLAFGSMRPIDSVVLQIFAVAILGLWIIRAVARKEYRFLMPPVAWAGALFVAYAFWRYTEAPIEYNARQEVILILVYALFFFAILDNLNRQEWFQLIALALVFIGALISCYALYQFLSGNNAVWNMPQYETYKGRASGTYVSPNHFAGLLVMLLPLGIALTFVGKMSLLLRVFVGYATLLVAGGLAVTVSRGAWAAAAVPCALFLLFILKKRELRIPALIILVALALGAFVFARKSFQASHRVAKPNVENAVTLRKHLWAGAVQIWRNHFWFGAGPNHFDALYPQYRADEVQYQPLRAHNDYLDALADYGLAGALLAAAVFALLFYGVWRSWKYVQRSSDLGSRSSNRTAIVLGATLALIGILTHGLTDFNFHIPANALVAAVLMALLAGYSRYATERFWLPMRVPGRALLVCALLAAGAYLGWQISRLGPEALALRQAAILPPDSQEALGRLERARQAEPMNWKTFYEIGENYRLRSFKGLPGYEALAREAMKYFEKAAALNPYDAYSPMRYGMCLHWLGRGSEAQPYFDKANRLDRNNTFFAAHTGWHYFQLGEYEKAREWLKRSMDLTWGYNEMAASYFFATERKLAEMKEGQPAQVDAP